MENRRFTITELSSHFPQISRSLLHEIVTKHLLFKKVFARWVPKNLTPEHKMQRLGAVVTFLQRYHGDGDEFLDRIVTGDETWISHFTPETKQQSMHWRHSGSPVRTKFKQTLSVRKVMCTVFWDRKGILLIDFLPRGEKVNADRYYETLRKLRRAILNKRRGMLTAGVVLLHDSARSHTARLTAPVLTEFGWELFDHPPYSPDLAPSDFHVFLHLKKFLFSGERFGNDEELKTSVTRWFHSQVAEFYDRGIQKLIPRYDKDDDDDNDDDNDDDGDGIGRCGIEWYAVRWYGVVWNNMIWNGIACEICRSKERIPNLTGEQSDGITVFRIPPMTSLMLHRCRTGAINLQRWWQSPSAAISESDWFLYRAGISRRMTSCTVVSWRADFSKHLRGRPAHIELDQLYSDPIRITFAKWSNLQELKKFIPHIHHSFFDDLKYQERPIIRTAGRGRRRGNSRYTRGRRPTDALHDRNTDVAAERDVTYSDEASDVMDSD
ncbi:hypothetical protein ANN_21918 [Periplaneta americana]|uniref:Histone-lysine N-methyltransferase SETMAR n=1 Tax=Periplaneta americana TaxID=6978 RepID=A0ABQ8S6P4_PERAM|nr:hypothetical protein ANN_21918 [Periplaneta americana]